MMILNMRRSRYQTTLEVPNVEGVAEVRVTSQYRHGRVRRRENCGINALPQQGGITVGRGVGRNVSDFLVAQSFHQGNASVVSQRPDAAHCYVSDFCRRHSRLANQAEA